MRCSVLPTTTGRINMFIVRRRSPERPSLTAGCEPTEEAGSCDTTLFAGSLAVGVAPAADRSLAWWWCSVAYHASTRTVPGLKRY